MSKRNNLPEATLCILIEEAPSKRVLLGFKKSGFGQGKVSGFGGKVEPGESVREAALREMWEETSVRIASADLEVAGRLDFIFPHKPTWSQRVHLFLAKTWRGTPAESEEMIPQWYEPAKLPYEQMWEDGRHWLPRLLAGERFEAEFVFGEDCETIERWEFRPQRRPD